MIDKIIAYIQADRELQELIALVGTMSFITAMFPIAFKLLNRKN